MSQGLVHHIELYVSDLKKTIDFWGWLLEELGYSLFQEWDSGRSWKLGETYLVFVQAEDRFLDVPYHRCRVGLNHLAFHASSRQQVDELTDKLQDRGIRILYPEKHPFAGGPEYYAVFFEDPDRMKVELVAPKLIHTHIDKL
ncbi:VOC family protein [Sporosarcina sp. YIM B06819]|uniref:VOC family protein n=1 Tax=Sporosarcina sp. YIM B06819 TaxID=3081769 RepID=UPI00298C1CB1|nr:VOC family protein [Sporosarcina sp. YIM B06819]